MQIDFIQTIWIAMDLTIFLAIILKKTIQNGQGKMQQRSIERGTMLDKYFGNIISSLGKYILIFIVSYLIVFLLPNEAIQVFLKWYMGIYVVVLLPLFLNWIKEDEIDDFKYVKLIQMILLIVLSVVGYIYDKKNVNEIENSRTILNVWITIDIVLLFSLALNIREKKKKNFCKRLPKRGIRKDLYYRTPKLDVDVSYTKLAGYCERYFDTYLKKYQKLGGVCNVEYVTLEGDAIKIWYKKVAYIIRWVVVVSLLFSMIEFIQGMKIRALLTFIFVSIFWLIIIIYKCCNLQHLLYTMAIRTAYDVWGYYLDCGKKKKYIGTVQMIDRTKYHYYVHSFLDIAALCRAVATRDEATEKCDICIVAKNMSELFVGYTDYEDDPQWTMIIPLWIVALFEFKVTKKIHMEVKNILIKCCNKNTWPSIEIFLQSFWADMVRKNLENGVSDHIKEFKMELFKELPV